MNALVQIDAAGKPTSLELPKSLPFERWVELGRQLHAEWRDAEGRRTQVLWWIGDWWAFGGEADDKGNRRYGERAKVAATGIFGVEFQTCMNAASVARAFSETSRRREALSFSHHAEVTAISNKSPQAADGLLARAETEHLSTRDLRAERIRVRTRLGDFPARPRADDPDPEDEDYVAICRKWNRAQLPARLLFLQSLEELGIVEVQVGVELQDIRLRA